jgi:hypothetical protein
MALAGVAVISACSGDVTGLPSAGSKNSVNGKPNSENPASSDTTQGGSPGEWHLATIRGVVLGTNGWNTDTTSSAATVISGAKVEIHKIGLKSATSAAGDSASSKFQDLGIVATATTDASGRFEYVLSDPIVVKSGQSSPMTTYHLTITPPAGSPFAAQSDVQVWFMEQFPANQTAVNYYLFPPKH